MFHLEDDDANQTKLRCMLFGGSKINLGTLEKEEK